MLTQEVFEPLEGIFQLTQEGIIISLETLIRYVKYNLLNVNFHFESKEIKTISFCLKKKNDFHFSCEIKK